MHVQGFCSTKVSEVKVWGSALWGAVKMPTKIVVTYMQVNANSTVFLNAELILAVHAV